MDYLHGALAAVAYGAVGFALLGLGYLLVDVLTPGRLADLIWRQKNGNAAIVLSSGLFGTGLVVTTAILTSGEDVVAGLVSTAVFGVLGLVLTGISFLLLDLMTPGRLGEILVEPVLHPAAWVTATVQVVVGMIVSASIS